MTIQAYANGRTAAEIAESLERSILAGDLRTGEALPPIRRLAADLSVSAGTVASAYRLLGSQGLTSADRRRGTRVREARREHAPVRQPIPVPGGVTDLSTGNPDPRLLPDPIALLGRLDYSPAVYGSGVGDDRYLEAARHRFEDDGIAGDAVTATFGALDAIGKILASNLSKGDAVALEDPGWAALIDLVERGGYVAVPLPLDLEGPTPDGLWEALAGGAKAVVVTARAQNPTGASVTPTRADELRQVLARYPGRLVLEDDHACGLVETKLATVVGSTERYAAVRSIAKGYGPDLRVAAVSGDAATIARLDVATATGAGFVSHLMQQLVLAMWEDAGVSEQLESASRIYGARRIALCEELRQAGVSVAAPTGLNVWIPVDDEATAVGGLLARGWLVAPGAMFRIATPPAIRVTTAALPVERVAECAAAIAAAVTSASSKGRRAGSGG